MDYNSLKTAAKLLRQQGVKVQAGDLIALAPKNDPFYAGAPAQQRDGRWFAAMYRKLGGGSGLHLRRVHYRILDLPAADRALPINLSTNLTGADGKKRLVEFTHYENYDRCWEWLTEAAKSARWLNLVPIDAFVDRRAKEESFSFYARWQDPDDEFYDDPTPGYEVVYDDGALETPVIDDLPRLGGLPGLPQLMSTGYDGLEQPYHIEIWVEKSEGEDVFLPLCRKYGVNFVPGVGDMSITTTYDFCERVRRANRPAKLLYVSDFDPSGFNMPIAVARKLEHFVRNYGFEELDITLEPVMLTEQQVQTYNLPPMPVKDSDPRKDEWERRYGGAVELNAMFARDERIIAARGIVEAEILRYYDPDLPGKARRQRQALQRRLNELREEVIEADEVADEYNEILATYNNISDEWDGLAGEYDDLVAPLIVRSVTMDGQLSALEERLRELDGKVSDMLGAIDLDAANEYPLPESLSAPVNGALFHSGRGYWQQMAAYHQHKRTDMAEWMAWLAEVGVDDE